MEAVIWTYQKTEGRAITQRAAGRFLLHSPHKLLQWSINKQNKSMFSYLDSLIWSPWEELCDWKSTKLHVMLCKFTTHCQETFVRICFLDWCQEGGRRRENHGVLCLLDSELICDFEIIGILEAQGFEVWRSGLWLFFYIYHFSSSTKAFFRVFLRHVLHRSLTSKNHMHYILQRYLQFSSGIFPFPELNSNFVTNFDRALRGVRVEVQGITRRKGGTRWHSSLVMSLTSGLTRHISCL